jgi:hypothetical protein
MGLDMYLKKQHSKYRKDDGTLSTNWDDCELDRFGRSNRVTLTEMVGYWCETNHIHRWFVENVQEGEDDCKEYYVSIKQLHELRDICFDILSKLHGMEIRVPKKSVKEFKEAFKEVNDKCRSIQRIKIDINNFETISNLTGYHTLTKSQIEKCGCNNTLPTQSGFFLGSCSYNGWYLNSLVKTIKMLDEIFEKHDENNKIIEMDKKNNTQTTSTFAYYYQASW